MFGENIKTIRKEKKMSQEMLAKKLQLCARPCQNGKKAFPFRMQILL